MHIKFYLFIFILLAFSSCKSTKNVVVENEINTRLSDVEQRQFKYYFYEALRLKEDRKYGQALETFKLCMAIDSLDAGVQSEVGMMYASIGLTSDALKCLENAFHLQPDNWWYSIRLIAMYSDLKKWNDAIAVTKQIEKFFPNKKQVYTMQAALYKQTKEYDKAIAAYDKLESLSGIDESTSFEKFQLYIEDNKPKKGVAEIDKLVNKYPTQSRYKILRGDIYLQQKMPDKAFEIYQNVLQVEPQNAFVYVSLSEYYKYINKPEKALESIVSALKSKELDVDTKMQVLGQYVDKLMQDTTKLDETESLFKLLVDDYPLEEQVHGYYEVFLQFLKRYDEAKSELETMININPKNEQSWLRMVQISLAEQNFNDVVKVTDRAIENLPTLPIWYFYRGISQFQLKDYDGALISYSAGLPLVAANQAALKSDFYSQIADTHFKLNNKSAAFEAYELSLAANPNNNMVMNNYAYYLSLDSIELKKAEKMSAKTVELEPKNSTFLDTYAWILYQQGSYSLAKFYIERAIDNMPKEEESGVILEHYGDILWKIGADDAKALEMWQKSYESGNKTEELKLKIENKGGKR